MCIKKLIQLFCLFRKSIFETKNASDTEHAYYKIACAFLTFKKKHDEEICVLDGSDESLGSIAVIHNHDKRDFVMERTEEHCLNFHDDSVLAQENKTPVDKYKNGSATTFPIAFDQLANNDDTARKLINDVSNNTLELIKIDESKTHACSRENCWADAHNINGHHIQGLKIDPTYCKNDFDVMDVCKKSLGAKLNLFDNVNWFRCPSELCDFMAERFFAGPIPIDPELDDQPNFIQRADESNLRALYLLYLGRPNRAEYLRDSSFRRASLCVISIFGSDLLQRLADLGFYVPAISEDVQFVMRATIIQRMSTVITHSSTDVSYTITWHIVPVDRVDSPALDEYLQMHLERGYSIPVGNEQLGRNDLQAAMNSNIPFQLISTPGAGREGYKSRFAAEECPVIFLGHHVDNSRGVQAHTGSHFIVEGSWNSRHVPIQLPIQVVSNPYPNLSECTVVPSGASIHPHHRYPLAMPISSGFSRYVESPNPASQVTLLNGPTAQSPKRNPKPDKDNNNLE